MGLRGIQRAALNELKADTYQGTEFFLAHSGKFFIVSGNPEHDNKARFASLAIGRAPNAWRQ
jgi:hypothetical protein